MESRPNSNGMLEALPGNRAICVGWVAQKAQWSRVTEVAGSPCPSAAGTILMPAALQISVQASPPRTDIACDIDGAIAANSIAIHAIHAAQRRMIVLKTMPPLYQRFRLPFS